MFNVGRNNPRVRAALDRGARARAARLGRSSASTSCRRCSPRSCCAGAPSSVGRVLFTSSGTESVEAAIKLGRAATGRSRVLSAEHGFHGLTLGALSANGEPRVHRPLRAAPAGLRARSVRRPRRARGASCRRRTSRCSSSSRSRARASTSRRPATSRARRSSAAATATLFCVDEVQTGFGRTGTLLALEHWGLEPDLVTVAKSLSGGYVPVGALLMSTRGVRGRLRLDASTRSATARPSRRTTSRWPPGWRRCTSSTSRASSSARRGWASCCSSARARSSSATRSSSDVRGLGLMWAIEFGEPPGGSRTWRLLERIAARRSSRSSSSCRSSPTTASSARSPATAINVIKALPPLVVTEEDVDWFVPASRTRSPAPRRCPARSSASA